MKKKTGLVMIIVVFLSSSYDLQANKLTKLRISLKTLKTLKTKLANVSTILNQYEGSTQKQQNPTMTKKELEENLEKIYEAGFTEITTSHDKWKEITELKLGKFNFDKTTGMSEETAASLAKALTGHATLSNISLNKVDFEGKAANLVLQAITTIKTITKLSITESKFEGYAFLENIAHLPLLKALELRNIELNDKRLKKLKLPTSLKHLDLSENKLKDPDIKELPNLPSLENLNLSSNKIGMDTIDTIIEKFKSLKKLNLRLNGFKPEELQIFTIISPFKVENEILSK